MRLCDHSVKTMPVAPQYLSSKWCRTRSLVCSFSCSLCLDAFSHHTCWNSSTLWGLLEHMIDGRDLLGSAFLVAVGFGIVIIGFLGIVAAVWESVIMASVVGCKMYSNCVWCVHVGTL